MSLSLLLTLAGVLLVSTVAAFARRRRRNALVPYTPAATALQWIDGPPTLNAIGATANSRAIVVDQRGAAFAGGPAISYSSGTPANATVNSSTGLVTAVANGTSVITASATGLTSITQTATVSQTVASITGVSNTLATDDASSGTFSPSGLDATGHAVAGATFAYAVDYASILSVNASTGAWAGQSAGTAHVTITASPGGAQFVVSATVIHATFVISQSPTSPAPGASITYTATYNGADVTSSTAFSTSAPTIVTVDPPTLTGVPSPTSITQGTGPITVTWPCTNPRSTQTLGGLPTGVSAGSATVVDSTHISFALTATGTATTGSANLYLIDTTHGNSGTQAFTVNASGGAPALPTLSATVLARWYVGASSDTTTDAAACTNLTDLLHGYVFTQATAGNKPIYRATGLNSRPCLEFTSASSSYMQTATNLGATLFPTTGFTVVMFFKHKTVGTTQRLLSCVDTTANTGYRFGSDTNPNWVGTFYTGSAHYDTGWGPANTTTQHLLMSGATSGGTDTIYLDSDVASNSNGGISYAACTTNPVTLGGDLNGGGSFADLYLGEIWITTNMGSTDRQAAHAYGQSTWGTP